MPSLWIVWIIVQEYGYSLIASSKLHAEEGCHQAAANRTLATGTPFPHDDYQERYRPASKPQQYIDYKLHYGLRYNPPPHRNVTQERERKKLLLPPKQTTYEPPSPPLLSVFHIISFVNGPCVPRGQPDNATAWAGVCYHEQECSLLNGTPMDSCAGGFGVCCVFQFGCDGRTEQNVSYFHSPNYPSAATEALPCGFTLLLQRTVRQVLLEFQFFELQPPQLGNCIEDQFIISVQNDQRTYPVLCGINTGQHMYLDIDRAYSHRLYLSAVFNSKQPRAFLVKITQLKTHRAPASCLQFHDGVSGVLKSFNYDNSSVLVTNRKASYFNNLNYAICIRRHTMFCNVVLTNIDTINGKENTFQLVNIAEGIKLSVASVKHMIFSLCLHIYTDGSSLIPPNQAGVEVFSCPDDFIAIDFIRLCGERLNDGSLVADASINKPVTYSSSGPIVVAVRTDQSIVGRGFKLSYTQLVS
uniref:CUB domain-containing protein n=1 Tax=Anopheles christyi TaxID=43041 RepID=A0A182K6E3_9DIPT